MDALQPKKSELLALLQDDAFRQALGQQPGYDTRETGTRQM